MPLRIPVNVCPIGSRNPARLQLNELLALQEARQLRNDLILHASTRVKINGQAVYEQVAGTTEVRSMRLKGRWLHSIPLPGRQTSLG